MAATVRKPCLGTITKLLHYSPAEVLNVVLLELPISHFIASLLGAQQPSITANALQMAELLMLKMPDVLSPLFLKEGVVHAIEQLAAQAPKLPEQRPARMVTRSVRRREDEVSPAAASSDAPPAAPQDAAAAAGDSSAPSSAELRKAVFVWASRFRKVTSLRPYLRSGYPLGLSFFLPLSQWHDIWS